MRVLNFQNFGILSSGKLFNKLDSCFTSSTHVEWRLSEVKFIMKPTNSWVQVQNSTIYLLENARKQFKCTLIIEIIVWINTTIYYYHQMRRRRKSKQPSASKIISSIHSFTKRAIMSKSQTFWMDISHNIMMPTRVRYTYITHFLPCQAIFGSCFAELIHSMHFFRFVRNKFESSWEYNFMSVSWKSNIFQAFKDSESMRIMATECFVYIAIHMYMFIHLQFCHILCSEITLCNHAFRIVLHAEVCVLISTQKKWSRLNPGMNCKIVFTGENPINEHHLVQLARTQV